MNNINGIEWRAEWLFDFQNFISQRVFVFSHSRCYFSDNDIGDNFHLDIRYFILFAWHFRDYCLCKMFRNQTNDAVENAYMRQYIWTNRNCAVYKCTDDPSMLIYIIICFHNIHNADLCSKNANAHGTNREWSYRFSFAHTGSHVYAFIWTLTLRDASCRLSLYEFGMSIKRYS